MIIDKNFILDYFKEYIFGFMYNDIENCIKAKANFAVATLLMAYSEKIGALISGNLGKSGSSKSDFNLFLEYLEFNGNKNHYKDFKIEYREESIKPIKTIHIYEAFRCGFIHEYFPKLPCEVINNPNNINDFSKDDTGINWVEDNGQKKLRFHTNAYFRDFKNAIDKIYKQIFIQNDPGIIINIEKSLKRIIDRELIINS